MASKQRASLANEAQNACPKRKWGPALLPAPTAPSEGSAGVRNLLKTRRPRPALDPGSPAQASLPIKPLPLARSPMAYLTAPPEGSLVFRPSGLLKPKFQRKPSDFPRPFLGNPLSRPASLTSIPKNLGSRVARQEDFSSGASSRQARKEPESPSHSCRRRSVHLSLPRPSCRCRPSGETGTSAPIT